MDYDSIFSLDAELNNLWVWCLKKSNHTKAIVDFIVKGRGKIYVEVQPGEFVCGRHTMAEALKAKPSTSWKRLKLLEKFGYLSIKSNSNYSIVKVLHWKELQEKSRKKEQVKGTVKGTVRGTLRDTEKNVKNGNHVKDKDICLFDEVWNAYPKKLGKKEAMRHFRASVKTDQDFEDIKLALKNYLIYVKGTDLKYVKNGSTWFNNWQDWVEWLEPAKVEVERKFVH